MSCPNLPIETKFVAGAYYVDSSWNLWIYMTPWMNPVTKDVPSKRPDPNKSWTRIEFVAEVKPEPLEPTGLGAVVENASGTKLVRTRYANLAGELAWRSTANGSHYRWFEIDQPKVLSEGYKELAF